MEVTVTDRESVLTRRIVDDGDTSPFFTLARVRAGRVGHTVTVVVVSDDGNSERWNVTPMNYHTAAPGDVVTFVYLDTTHDIIKAALTATDAA